jgi:predicted NACHT family NTPase
MTKLNQENPSRLFIVYRNYLLSKISKVHILGEVEERDLKEVFVELSVVDQRSQQADKEFLGMLDAAMRRHLNPFASTDWKTFTRSSWLEERRERSIKPAGLLRRGTKAIITGAPGSGKTTLLKYLALQANEMERLVVWLDLKGINKSLLTHATNAAANKGTMILPELWLCYLKVQLALRDAEIGFLRAHWDKKLKVNEIAVLLDGFDEIQDSTIERSLNECVTEFASGLHRNIVVISTRPLCAKQARQ